MVGSARRWKKPKKYHLFRWHKCCCNHRSATASRSCRTSTRSLAIVHFVHGAMHAIGGPARVVRGGFPNQMSCIEGTSMWLFLSTARATGAIQAAVHNAHSDSTT
eukprot:4276094-Amphidinium_carterae.1